MGPVACVSRQTLQVFKPLFPLVPIFLLDLHKVLCLMCPNHGTPSTMCSGLKPSELVEEDTMSLVDRILTPVEKENFAI